MCVSMNVQCKCSSLPKLDDATAGGGPVSVQQEVPGDGEGAQEAAAEDPGRPGENHLLPVHQAGAHEQWTHPAEKR